MNQKIQFNLFPGGKPKAVTLSYDDGREQDRRLVALLNKYGLKGTFHLNSGRIGEGISAGEIRELYDGHEVAVHSVTHPSLALVPKARMLSEVWEDRKSLEAMVGYPVCGMSYPNGSFNDEVVEVLRQCGIAYSRTTRNTGTFDLPDDYLRWHPTCHHKQAIEMGRKLVEIETVTKKHRPFLLSVWGHSFEFDRNLPDNSWEMIEEFCVLVGRNPEVWYATNMQVHNYHEGLRRLVFSADCSVVENPSAIELWFTVDNEPRSVGPGRLLAL